MHDIEDYTYDLPEELIAQEPALQRDESRLLCVDRERDAFSDHRFTDLPGLLKAGDLLVLNDTRVVPARLYGRKETGGRVELLVLDHTENDRPGPSSRRCLLKASKRPGVGCRILLDGDVSGVIDAHEADGLVRIAFEDPGALDDLMSEKGVMPLPPYIRRSTDDRRAFVDRVRFQTVYASRPGAVAAPTAGLHFTPRLLNRLAEKGVSSVRVTLHVGHGTFRPVRSRDIREHSVGAEAFRVDRRAADRINRTRSEGRRVIAVGTTVVRTLETLADGDGFVAPGKGRTRLMITPGYRFRAVSGLVTNFHLPASSLLFLVSAFAGIERIRAAYRWAVRKRYRFYSYGDAMLIL